MKRIVLFVLTNFAIILTLSVVLQLLGLTGYINAGRINMGALMAFCLVWGMGGALLSLQMSRWIAKTTMGVRLVDGRTGHPDFDWLYQTVARLTQQAQLSMPEVGFYESEEVNAFATGPSRSRSLVAVSSGLFRAMRREEIEGVLAHEVTHIQNGDMVTMTLVQGVVNAFVMFLARAIAFGMRQSNDNRSPGGTYLIVFVLEIVFGILGMAIVCWFSRAREFRADAGGAVLAGKTNMIGALKRLMATKELVDRREPALATLKINGTKAMMLFATHPPLEARIRALESSH